MNIRTLKTELEFVNRAVDKSTTIPILNNVLIEIGKDACTITGTDLEVSAVSAFATVKNGPSFKTTVPSRSLLKIMAALEGEDADLSMDKANALILKSGTFTSKLMGMSPDTYPELPGAPQDRVTTVPIQMLAALFAAAKHAISPEESRFTLNGALFELGGGLLRVVATDGHRLSRAEAKCEGPKMRFLIPRTLMDLFPHLAKGENLEIGADESHIFFLSQNGGLRLLLGRKLTGNFPDYERVLPKWDGKQITVKANRESLLKLVRRIKPFTDERSLTGHLLFKSSVGESSLTIKSLISESSDVEDKIGALVEPLGTRLEACFNLSYVEQALAALNSDEVEVLLRDAHSAMEIRGTVDEEISVREVIMPMRL